MTDSISEGAMFLATGRRHRNAPEITVIYTKASSYVRMTLDNAWGQLGDITKHVG